MNFACKARCLITPGLHDTVIFEQRVFAVMDPGTMIFGVRLSSGFTRDRLEYKIANCASRADLPHTSYSVTEY
jgi:hypothetical protein